MSLLSPSASPGKLILDITGQCNLRCRYCCFFHSDTEPQLSDLPFDRWRALLKEAGDACVMRVSLRGGEPLSRPDFREIVQSIVDNRMRFSIQTNGTLVTPELADFIRATGRCDFCTVSIDGGEALHDAYRGKGSWRNALRGAKLLQERGIPLKISATVHRGNFNSLDETAKTLLVDEAFPRLLFSFATELVNTPPELALSPAETYEAMRSIVKLRRTYSASQLPPEGAVGQLVHWKKIVQAEKAGKLPKESGGRYCESFYTTLMLRSDGAYVPCSNLCGEVLGYAGEDPLPDVWQKSRKLQELRTLRLTDFPPKCESCPYRNGCSGNCPGHPHVLRQGFSCMKDFLASGGSLDD